MHNARETLRKFRLPAAIAGYLGKSDSLDQALAKFAERYADQTELDYEGFVKAVRNGRIQAATQE